MNQEINLIPQLNFWSVLLLICAGQAFFLSIILIFHKKGNITANRTLAVLIFFFSYYFAFIAAYWTNYLIEFPHMLGTLRILNYSWGPLFYLYVSALLAREKVFNFRKLLHFLPAIIYVIISYRIYIMDTDAKVRLLKIMLSSGYDNVSIEMLIPSALFNLHIFVYIIFSLKKINSFSKNINGNKNSLEYINFNWLKKFSIGFVGFFLAWFFYEILMFAGIKYYIEADYVITFFGVVVIYTIAIHTIRQPEIFSGISVIKPEAKYEKSSISEEEAGVYINKLDEIMREDKLYLKPDLNLKTLADLLDISQHRLSQVINEFLKMNFAEYLNNYRVEEAKARLVNPEFSNYTILSIAFDVGFNNKVSFNNAFKKITGITPSEYKFSKSPHYTN